MFNKILPISFIAGVMLSSNALAANFGSSAASTTAEITPTQCTALNNNVTIQLSKGVFAAYACSTTSVNAGACHSTGTFKSQTIGCSYTATFDSSGTPTGSIKSSAQCPDWDGSGSTPVGVTATFNGRLAFVGGSGGGTVGQYELGDPVCNGTSIDNLVN